LPLDEYGNCYIITVIDDFSRFVELRASKDATAASAARALIDVFGRFGAPQTLRSDNGPQYVAQLIASLLTAMNVTASHSIAYRPQSNSIVERANGEVLRHLRAMVLDSRLSSKWTDFLPFVQRILNATPHTGTNIAPAQLVYGNRISLNRGILTHFTPSSDSSSVQDHLAEMMRVQNLLINLSQEHLSQHQEEVAGKSSSVSIPFAVGDLVLVKHPTRPSSKLKPKWRGPFSIVERCSHSTFRVQHLASRRMSTQHVSSFKRFDGSRSDPVSVAAVDDDEFLVEAIVDHKGKTKRNLTFRVRWSGYPPSDDSWLKFTDVKDLAALDTYLADHVSLRKLKLGVGRG
jgi:hypothetical protein